MMEYELDATGAKVTNSGQLVARLRVRLDGTEFFPDEAWTDFAAVVLSWSCVAATQILHGEREWVTTPFMEGPYAVEMRYATQLRLRVRLTRRGWSGGSAILHEGEVDTQAWVESIIRATEAAAALCRVLKARGEGEGIDRVARDLSDALAREIPRQ